MRKKKRKKRTRVHLRILARPIGNFLNEPRPIFSKIITSVSPVIRVIGRGFPFLYKNPRNVPTNSLHSERPQWRLRHTVSDHAQQYRNKRRIVYVSRINEYGLSARHDTHWFFFSTGGDRERGENPRRREDGHVWKVFSCCGHGRSFGEFLFSRKPIIQTGRCGEGLSTVYPSVQTIRFFVPLGRGEVRKYIEERYRFLNNGVLSIEWIKK